MKNEMFTDLPQRIEEGFPEMENEMLMELRQKDDEYAQIHKRFYDLQEQYPFILEVLEGKGNFSLIEEEHAVLLEIYRSFSTDGRKREHPHLLPRAYRHSDLSEKTDVL